MKRRKPGIPQILILILLSAAGLTCQSIEQKISNSIVYKDPNVGIEDRVTDLLSRMTLKEKIGQMTLVEKNSVRLNTISEYLLGGVLSGGGGYPLPNTPESWADMTDAFQRQALKTRLGIPLLYGADAVHGHNNVKGTVIFPHNIGLGMTRDTDLAEKIGRMTAIEMRATGVTWNFAPCVAVPQDIRWGRTYEGFSENTTLVTELAAAFLRGQQNDNGNGFGAPSTVLATPKHFIGDGGTAWLAGLSNAGGKFLLDQGITQCDEKTLRRLFLPPYAEAVKEGARCIMVSFSSWREMKMHAHKYLLTDVLKGELGFSGFLVSDWKAIDQLGGDYYSQVVTSINAGLDMIMIPFDARSFGSALEKAVEAKDVSIERIDDAVRRILRVKFELGLFERPFANRDLLPIVGSNAHRALAREAVRKSLVLLKNADALPLSRDLPEILVAGPLADDLGSQCGGWTIEWQGGTGAMTEGTTILSGIRSVLARDSAVRYKAYGDFETAGKAAVGIVVVGEKPYAEGLGDRADLSLPKDQVEIVRRVRRSCAKLVVIILSGRPIIIDQILPLADAIVAAWLPGTEGAGVAEVMFGDYSFSGKLSFTWPKSMAAVPLSKTVGRGVLFPYGYGLK
ncbi:MAG: glycoside hydrolase family 3 C-terminal domain-containing protein [Spirochaetales bacterium]|nr:glycoside hydrolase family 3 C-terminal domain-containing protein [Spirochaetales bacterium]